jgi:hypothetical protein
MEPAQGTDIHNLLHDQQEKFPEASRHILYTRAQKDVVYTIE